MSDELVRDDKCNYTLSSGLIIHANLGVFGLDEYGCITTGYDDILINLQDEMTKEDRKQIGEMMIKRWKQWMDI